MTRPWTPPAVKWTANELAALKGELQMIDRDLAALHKRRASVRESIEALSQVLGMVAPEVPLVHVPVVRAQATYGGYGNLRAWLLATLEAAYPQALDTSALVDAAEAAFELKFSTPTSRARFRDNSLAKALRVARAAEEVERIDAGPLLRGPGVWRWRPRDQALVELQAAIQDAAG
jgi:hypothetical protein